MDQAPGAAEGGVTMLCTGNGRENLPPGCVEPEEVDDMFIPEPCCRYCTCFDGDYCTKFWNNMDESYCDPDRDGRDDYDYCDDFEWNGELDENPPKPEAPDPKWYKGREWQYKIAYRSYENQLKKWRKYIRGMEG